MSTAIATLTENNIRKYNYCTLECSDLSTCRELSLKLEREKTILEFSRLQGRKNKNVLSICLASWRNTPSFSAHEENKTQITCRKKKSDNQKWDFSEPSSLAFLSSLLKAPIRDL